MAKMVTLVDAAARLRMSYHATWRLILVGDVRAERRGGRWLLDATDVERLRRSRRRRLLKAAECVAD